jgi:hypothetical protein
MERKQVFTGKQADVTDKVLKSVLALPGSAGLLSPTCVIARSAVRDEAISVPVERRLLRRKRSQ